MKGPVLAAAFLTLAAGTGSNLSGPTHATLSFPRTMLLSQKLVVTHVDQVNHDTKRITFALPGGVNELSGVSPGGW